MNTGWDRTRRSQGLLPGIGISCCPVSAECDSHLTEAELASLEGCLPTVRHRAAAARIAARSLLEKAGYPDWPLPRRHGRPPVWPDGLAGSLSHSRDFAVAALADGTDWACIGVDVEPAEPLEAELLDVVASADELTEIGHDPLAARIVFSLKEAVYKAVHPLDGRFLEPHDVRVHLKEGHAETFYGRIVPARYSVDARIIALAAVSA